MIQMPKRKAPNVPLEGLLSGCKFFFFLYYFININNIKMNKLEMVYPIFFFPSYFYKETNKSAQQGLSLATRDWQQINVVR
jgi:hypothetical protein